MPRTPLSHLEAVGRPGSSFTFPPPPPSFSSNPSSPSLRQTTIVIAAGSSFQAFPHFHLTHTEYLQVVQGTAQIRLGGQIITATASSGALTVPRGVVHDWFRHPELDKEIDLVVREWTDPDDGLKEVFFRNLFGVLRDAPQRDVLGSGPRGKAFGMLPEGVRMGLGAGVIMAEGDNYLLPWQGLGGWWAARGLAVLVRGVGWALGLKGWYREYTPDWLVEKIEADSHR